MLNRSARRYSDNDVSLRGLGFFGCFGAILCCFAIVVTGCKTTKDRREAPGQADSRHGSTDSEDKTENNSDGDTTISDSSDQKSDARQPKLRTEDGADILQREEAFSKLGLERLRCTSYALELQFSGDIQEDIRTEGSGGLHGGDNEYYVSLPSAISEQEQRFQCSTEDWKHYRVWKTSNFAFVCGPDGMWVLIPRQTSSEPIPVAEQFQELAELVFEEAQGKNGKFRPKVEIRPSRDSEPFAFTVSLSNGRDFEHKSRRCLWGYLRMDRSPNLD